MVALFYFAGLLQLAIAAANLVAVRMFRYPEALAAAPESVRQVFWVQNAFIMLALVGMSGACFAFPAELSGGTGLGRGLAAFLALFWGARLAVQLFYYSPEERRKRRFFDILFLLAFTYLIIVYALASLSPASSPLP
ncbi:MAG TPA: hypothetical protein VNC50_01070 [Planctomycetia bacterium]|nr:hypothetical protein [Planctomycetia bacterium]